MTIDVAAAAAWIDGWKKERHKVRSLISRKMFVHDSDLIWR